MNDLRDWQRADRATWSEAEETAYAAHQDGRAEERAAWAALVDALDRDQLRLAVRANDAQVKRQATGVDLAAARLFRLLPEHYAVISQSLGREFYPDTMMVVAREDEAM